MKEYDEATLKKVQQTEMEILRDFIKVCDENNLTWFGDAGSGTGQCTGSRMSTARRLPAPGP